MKTVNYILLLCVILLFLDCSHRGRSQSVGKEDPSYLIVDGYLIGRIDERTLMREFKSFQSKKDKYTPDPASVSSIKEHNQDVHVIVFLGTWCGDSKRNVPSFIKTLEMAQNPKISVEYLGLNRKKVDDLGMTDTYEIKRVPTFIFTKSGKEFGRITENPEASMEADMSKILNEQ